MSSTITINGTAHGISSVTNVATLVESLKLDPKTVLVELNGTALLRSEWPQKNVGNGDKVELVRIVAGG